MNPLSATFAAAVAARNALYDRKMFNIHKLSRPVVSIGNLSVGGTGKTPFAITLGELFKARGIAFDILSRGYGRSSKVIAVVDPNGSAEQFGDEPLLMARKLQVPVIVGADRYQAGLLAESKFPDAQLHLLDDAFQHRRLHRDFDIVMLPAADIEDTLLPVGRLREPLSSLHRADVVVTEPETRVPSEAADVWRVRRELDIYSISPRFFPRDTTKAVAFCGIARPQQFFAALRGAGVQATETVAFPDHHRYVRADIDRLLRIKARAGAEVFVTTEKDNVRLKALSVPLQPLQIAPLRLVLEDPKNTLDHILAVLEQRSGLHITPSA